MSDKEILEMFAVLTSEEKDEIIALARGLLAAR